MSETIIIENALDPQMGVELILRLRGRLPNRTDKLTKKDYKDYCDRVMLRKPIHGKIYPPDGIWDYAWRKYKESK